MRTTLVKFSSAANDPARYSHKYDDTDEEAWRSFRYLGLFASFCALGFSAVALSSGSWVVGRGYNVGLWDNYCQYNVTENDTVEIGCLEERTKGQSTVIGLLLFAVAFGLLGTILCTCGICIESIYMKMYYFHSAGEIYFVCNAVRISFSSESDRVIGNSNQGQHSIDAGYQPAKYAISSWLETFVVLLET